MFVVVQWHTATVIPLGLLLFVHLRPTSWRRRRFVLFLRAFRGTSNSAALGPLARGVPRDTRVVFLAPPFRQASSWDPISLGLAGFSITRPLSSAPIHLRSDDAEWRRDVAQLASEAVAVVVDAGDQTPAVLEEIQMLKSLPTKARLLCLVRQQAQAAVLGAPDESMTVPFAVVPYTERVLPALVRRLLVTIGVFIPLELLGAIVYAPADDVLIPRLAFVTVGALSAAALVAMTTSATRGYSRRSAAELRSALDQLLRSDAGQRRRSTLRRELARWPLALAAVALVAAGYVAVDSVSTDLETLRSSSRIGSVVYAHHRLARIPFGRGYVDPLLAARWAGEAKKRSLSRDAELALQLKSLAAFPLPDVQEAVDSALKRSSERFLAMTYRLKNVTTAGFAHDGEQVFTAGALVKDSAYDSLDAQGEPVVRLWSTRTGVPASNVFSLPVEDPYARPDADVAAMSPDGSFAAVAGETVVRLITFATGRTVDVVGHYGRHVAISRDSSSVAVYVRAPDHDGYVVRVLSRTGTLISESRIVKLGGLIRLQFDRCGGSVLVVGPDGISLLNAATGAVIAAYDALPTESVYYAAIRDDASVLVVTNEFRSVHFDDYANGGHVRVLKANRLTPLLGGVDAEAQIDAVAMNRDTSLIAIGTVDCDYSCSDPGQPVSLGVWRIADRLTRVCSYSSHRIEPVSSLAFSPESDEIAAVDNRGLSLWRWGNARQSAAPAECEHVGAIATTFVSAVGSFSTDGTYILTTSGSSVRLWRRDLLEAGGAGIPSDSAPERALDQWLTRSAFQFNSSLSLDWRYAP